MVCRTVHCVKPTVNKFKRRTIYPAPAVQIMAGAMASIMGLWSRYSYHERNNVLVYVKGTH